MNGHLGAEFPAVKFQQVQLLRPVGEGVPEDADSLAAGHGGAQPYALEFTGHMPHADIRFQPRLVTDLPVRSEEHTSELQSRPHLVCRLLLEKKKKKKTIINNTHKTDNQTCTELTT